MAVSVVDLRCVFGRSLVVFDQSTLLFTLLVIRTHYVVTLCWSDRPIWDVGYGNTIIIYRSLYSSNMCSYRACSSNP